MRWRRAERILWRTAPGYLVLGTVDGQYIEVSGPGADVWAGLEDWISEEELTATLARSYQAPHDVVSHDVRSLLGQLHAQGYVDQNG